MIARVITAALEKKENRTVSSNRAAPAKLKRKDHLTELMRNGSLSRKKRILMTIEELKKTLEPWLEKRFQSAVKIYDVIPLSGGACQENSLLEF